LNFKYSESVTAHTFDKVHAYDVLFRDTQKLTKQEVATFILSAKTPRPALLKLYGYEPTAWPGVYQSRALMVNRVGLIVLNELSPAPHNAYVKCFASRKKEQVIAFDTLEGLEVSFPTTLLLFLTTLYRLLSQSGELDMIRKGIKGEDLLKWGEQLQELLVSLSIKQRLEGIQPSEVLSHYKADEVLSHYKADEVLSHYQTDEVLSHYKADEVLSHYQTDEVLSHYQTDEVLSHYQTDEVLSHYQTDEVLSHYQTELAQREPEVARQMMLKNWQQILQFRFNLSAEALQPYLTRGQTLTLETLELLYKRTLLVDSLTQFDYEMAQLESNSTKATRR